MASHQHLQDESNHLLRQRPISSYTVEYKSRCCHEGRFRAICWCTCLILWALLIGAIISTAVVVSIHYSSNSNSSSNNSKPLMEICGLNCRLSIVESIPVNMTVLHVKHISTYESWMTLLQEANTSIDIASYYWILNSTINVTDGSSAQGLHVLDGLRKAHSRGVKIRVIQNIPSKESGDFTDDDTEKLSHDGVIDLRSINFTSLQGSGILHTKLWLVDGEHFYVGSANTDWRSLTQVKELGLMGQNCSCITKDANKIFEVYWALSNASHLLSNWDQSLYASFNISKPAQMLVNDSLSEVYWSSSPPSFSPPQRTDDITALLDVINSSKTFINIAVMDYLPAVVYTKHKKYWPVIDDALRTAAYERGIKVRLLGSCWKHTPRDMVHFMRSLGSWNITGPLGGSIETKYFIVPELSNESIPFSRVNHNKYMVTDDVAYITTSNWSGDYFIDTGGVSCLVKQMNNTGIPSQLQDVFERDWNSIYTDDNCHF